MENRFRRFLLTVVASLAMVAGSLALAEDVDPTAAEEAELQPVIQPEVERTEFRESRIDTEDFEITPYVGLLSIEDFGTEPVYGLRLAYHITESLFAEGNIGMSTADPKPVNLADPSGATLLTDDESKYQFYNLSLGFNILPGEAFVTQNLTYNNDLYLIGGIGSTDFAGSNRMTINWGLGYRLFLRDFVALRVDFRDHMFSMDDYFVDKTISHNLELSLGAGFFF